MSITSSRNLIKTLHATMPRGSPFNLAALAKYGVSAQLAAKYVESGWLSRLAQGVYAFSGDTLTLHGSIKFLQSRVPGLHVAGRSALALQGVRHNLAQHDVLVMWGNVRFTLPEWFVDRFPSRYVSAQMFKPGKYFSAIKSIATPPGSTDGLKVSVPERAILELLYEVGTKHGVEEAHNIILGLRNPRKEILGKLLASCTSVKTVRLFVKWSREAGVVDADKLLARYKISMGSDKRWMSRLRDGTLLTLHP